MNKKTITLVLKTNTVLHTSKVSIYNLDIDENISKIYTILNNIVDEFVKTESGKDVMKCNGKITYKDILDYCPSNILMKYGIYYSLLVKDTELEIINNEIVCLGKEE